MSQDGHVSSGPSFSTCISGCQRDLENASDSDDKAARDDAADSGRDDSWLSRRTDLATPGKGRHESSMWNPLRADEKNGAADSEREGSLLAGQADSGTPNEDEGMDSGPLTRPSNGYVESKDGLEVVDAVAVAALDTDTRTWTGAQCPETVQGTGAAHPKLGNEVKAEMRDVRRDKTEVSQLAGPPS